MRTARTERPRWVHALILAGVVLAFGVSFRLLSGVIGITSPWLVLLLMFYFLAVAKVAEPLFRLKVPAALRPLRPWERNRDVHRRLGVLRFGRLLRLSPLSALNSAVYLDRGDKDPARVRLWIESSEASHFWAAVLFTPYLVFAALRGMWSVVAWFSLAQLLLNVYPILHLRYVRGRLDRAFRVSREPRRARVIDSEGVVELHELSPEDRSFQLAFEACTVEPSEFRHAAHVRLAYAYLVEHDVETAVRRMREALLKFLEHNDIPRSKFHETITRAWVLAVRHFMNKGASASSADFIAKNPELLDSRIMLTHYSASVLFSPDARAAFVEPDLDPIPPRGRNPAS